MCAKAITKTRDPGYDDLLKGGCRCIIVAIADFRDTLGAVCGKKSGAAGCDGYRIPGVAMYNCTHSKIRKPILFALFVAQAA